jgi:molybdopterin molybdotransferase
MSLFLQTISVEEAVRLALSVTPVMPVEDVPLACSGDRVLASDIRADIDIPGFNRSVMDGYAVSAADTTGAGEAIPAMVRMAGRVSMGAPVMIQVQPGECVYVPTGGRVPDGADAVAMIEYCEQVGDIILVKRAVAPGENMIRRGEDFATGEVVLASGRRISSQDMGVLAAVGCATVPVRKIPRLGIISTGNELVPVSGLPVEGQVRDANSSLCGGFVQEYGCEACYFGIIPDTPEDLEITLSLAVAGCDLVLLSGGSSKDERDISALVISRIGKVIAHGIALSPGKPTIIGHVGQVPVIGLPGHPASAYIVLFVIVHHMLRALTGETHRERQTVSAVLSQNIPSARGREDYVRVSLAGGIATPLFGKSGLLNTLVRSTGVIRIPAGCEGLEQGSPVEVLLW